MDRPASPLRQNLKPSRWIASSNLYLGSRLVMGSRRQGRVADIVVIATLVVQQQLRSIATCIMRLLRRRGLVGLFEYGA